MSKIFVDQVDPKTGTSLTLGTSGDTVNIPSGVTIANAGTATGFGVSLANGVDNRVITASSATALNGEANLTFDGNDLTVGNGNIVFGTASKGVYLGVTSATASNLLDDFEEGTYTYAMTTSGGGTVSNRSGYTKLAYTKIGRMVNVVGKVETNGLGDLASQNGDIQLSLPFAIGNFDDFAEQFSSPVMWFNTSSMSSMNMLFWKGVANDSFCNLVNVSSTLVDSAIQGNQPGSSLEMRVNITYQAA